MRQNRESSLLGTSRVNWGGCLKRQICERWWPLLHLVLLFFELEKGNRAKECGGEANGTLLRWKCSCRGKGGRILNLATHSPSQIAKCWIFSEKELYEQSSHCMDCRIHSSDISQFLTQLAYTAWDWIQAQSKNLGGNIYSLSLFPNYLELTWWKSYPSLESSQSSKRTVAIHLEGSWPSFSFPVAGLIKRSGQTGAGKKRTHL